ncbi:hypothetical protein GB937_001708 [Aspergillus fischeri]|nr:hypothetical protein GB937_001708 [Aspergillus fischeri]
MSRMTATTSARSEPNYVKISFVGSNIPVDAKSGDETDPNIYSGHTRWQMYASGIEADQEV